MDTLTGKMEDLLLAALDKLQKVFQMEWSMIRGSIVLMSRSI